VLGEVGSLYFDQYEVYRLKNQTGLANFAGQKVEMTGTLDSKTDTIDNTDIEAALAAGRRTR